MCLVFAFTSSSTKEKIKPKLNKLIMIKAKANKARNYKCKCEETESILHHKIFKYLFTFCNSHLLMSYNFNLYQTFKQIIKWHAQATKYVVIHSCTRALVHICTGAFMHGQLMGVLNVTISL